MNQYRDLVAKLEAIQNRVEDTPVSEEQSHSKAAPTDQLLVGEENVEECGLPGMSNMPSGMMGTPKQQDNVTMNVSMNGSGAGGIRDLMGILKNIENGGAEPEQHSHNDDEIVIGMGEEQVTGGFDRATTAPDTKTAPMSAAYPTGNDLASKGAEFPNVAGGGNPMQETLMARLASLYQEVKLR